MSTRRRKLIREQPRRVLKKRWLTLPPRFPRLTRKTQRSRPRPSGRARARGAPKAWMNGDAENGAEKGPFAPRKNDEKTTHPKAPCSARPLTLVSSPRGHPIRPHGLAGAMPFACDEPFTAVWLSSSRQAASMASKSRRVLAGQERPRPTGYTRRPFFHCLPP
jgi:hypothetical protein